MGLRQGYILSSLRFLLVTKCLSRDIMEAKQVGIISRVRIGRDLSLTHLLFVEDILLFTNGSLREAMEL